MMTPVTDPCPIVSLSCSACGLRWLGRHGDLCPVCIADATKHALEAHPDFEYATTSGPRKAFDEHHPDGEGWLRNTHRGRDGWERFDYHEEAYWMRRRQRAPEEALPPRTATADARLRSALAALVARVRRVGGYATPEDQDVLREAERVLGETNGEQRTTDDAKEVSTDEQRNP